MTPEEARSIVEGLRDLVNGEDEERPIQRYLERFPYLLCARIGYVQAGVVVSQFPLGADYVPDFAFVHSTSRGDTLHLVEIEGPSLQLFTKSDSFHQKFNHAFQQLQDWALWCEKNQQYLVNTLGPLFELGGDGSSFRVNCLLIAGRRSELSTKRRRERFAARDSQLPKGLGVTTYDGFIESLPTLQLHIQAPDITCVSYRSQAFFEKHIANVLSGHVDW